MENNETPPPPVPEIPAAPASDVQHGPAEVKLPVGQKPPLGRRVVGWYKGHKRWSIPASVLLLLIILALLPTSRYAAAGLVMKKDVSITVKDSVLLRPVSGATVTYGGSHVQTDANGQATLHHVKVGTASIQITKKYYQDKNFRYLVPLSTLKNPPIVMLVATGRPIPVQVMNYISGKPVQGATISVSGTTAQTDSTGNAVVVVPTGIDSQEATVSNDGFNDAKLAIHPNSSDAGSLKKINLVPAGEIYYLSKATGKLDLMKASLDGSNPQVVLAGTGYEQDSNSSISSSPDGNYIALRLQRSAGDTSSKLYIMSSQDDKLLSVDSENANFSLDGWWGDTLVYTSSRVDLPDWQTGKNKLKAYEATSGKSTLLDQSAGVNDSSGSAGETYDFVTLIKGNVVYAKNWTVDSGSPVTPDSLNSISVNGQNHAQIATYDGEKYTMTYSQHSAKDIYIWQQDSGNYTAAGNFYDYEYGSASPKPLNINNETFYSSSQIFLPSASGKQVLWDDYRDGNNDILVSDFDSGSTTTINAGSYTPYSWYTDKYVLVSANSTLYILGAGGGDVHKIAAYQMTGY